LGQIERLEVVLKELKKVPIKSVHKFFLFISVEEILRSVYTVAAPGPDRISQTVPSPSSGNLQSDGLGIISQTESSTSSGNLQTGGAGIISQTESSLSSGTLQTGGPGIISQTESSPSTGNLQTLVERIFRLDRISWRPDTFLERVGLKLEQKFSVQIICTTLSSEKGGTCVTPRNDWFCYFPLLW
jgi:hypothetical protein